MPSRKQIYFAFIGDLEEHNVREACQGAAEYAATRPGLVLDPWSTYPGRTERSTLDDLKKRADGLLIAERDLRELCGKSARLTKPHVFYLANEPHRRTLAVALDERAIGRMAAEHLMQRGYRHLAFFGLPDLAWARERGEGFFAAAAERGVPVQCHEVLSSVLRTYRPRHLKEHHASLPGALLSLPSPCGIFAAHDVGACYIIQAARELGLGIPEPFGVVGVDDDPIANAAAGMGITSVQVPFREAGWRAAELLDAMVRGEHPAPPPLLQPMRVIARASTNAFMVEDPLLRKALALIERQRGTRLTVQEVAQELRTNPVTLNQRFQHHLKTTPATYILQRRFEYAKDLLRSGKLTVEEVSDTCGFHDVSYFCTVFKRATGTTPGSWRPLIAPNRMTI
ncbi:MAG: substrate-binding domain-containing protein [Verrucomicrobia bacterium]|nr:substrate-binding domain-containing protein [Verrucomicrobiota bacterium]